MRVDIAFLYEFCCYLRYWKHLKTKIILICYFLVSLNFKIIIFLELHKTKCGKLAENAHVSTVLVTEAATSTAQCYIILQVLVVETRYICGVFKSIR